MLVGLMLLAAGIIYYFISKASGGVFPEENTLILIGILFVVLGCIGIWIWEAVKNKVM